MNFFKMPLHKRYGRQFRHNLGRFLSVFVLLVVMLGVCLGMYISSRDGLGQYKKVLKSQDVYDAVLQTVTEIGDIDEVEKEVGDIKIDKDFYIDKTVDTDLGPGVKLRLYDEREKTARPLIEKGHAPKAGEIFLERNFANAQKIKIGDTVDFGGKKLKVSATGVMPDYVDPRENMSDFLGDAESFGPGMMSSADFSSFAPSEYNYTYAVSFVGKLTKHEQDKKLIKLSDAASKQTIVRSITPNDINPRIAGPQDKIRSVNQSMALFIIMSLLMVVFILISYSRHIIKSETGIIGLLLASGYKKKEIALHYSILPSIVTLVSGVCAALYGFKFFAGYQFKTFATYYSIPLTDFTIDKKLFAATVFLPTLLIFFTTYMHALSLMRHRAVELLQNSVAKKNVRLEPKLKSDNFARKFRVRLWMSSKSNVLRLFAGIFIATWLLMFALGMNSTFPYYTKSVLATTHYNYQYMLKAPAEPKGDEYFEKVSVKPLVIRNDNFGDDMNENIDVFGISPKSKYFKVDKGRFPKDDSELAISSSMADKLKLGVGDDLKTYDKVQDKNRTFKIVGVVNYRLGQTFFTDRETLNGLADYPDDFFMMLLSDKKLDIPKHAVSTRLNRNDIIDVTQLMQKFMEKFIDMMVWVGIICYIVLLYLMTGLMLDENRFNISLAKVMGYRKREIEQLYLRQGFVTVVISLAISLPLSAKLVRDYWYKMMAHTTGWVAFVPNAAVYVKIAALAIVSYFIATFFHKRRIYKIPATEALKNRE